MENINLTLILILLIIGTGVGVIGYFSDGFKNWDKFNFFKKPPATEETQSVGGSVLKPIMSNGVAFDCKRLTTPPERFRPSHQGSSQSSSWPPSPPAPFRSPAPACRDKAADFCSPKRRPSAPDRFPVP